MCGRPADAGDSVRCAAECGRLIYPGDQIRAFRPDGFRLDGSGKAEQVWHSDCWATAHPLRSNPEADAVTRDLQARLDPLSSK